MTYDPQQLLVIHLGNSILKQIQDEAEKQALLKEIEELKQKLSEKEK